MDIRRENKSMDEINLDYSVMNTGTNLSTNNTGCSESNNSAELNTYH